MQPHSVQPPPLYSTPRWPAYASQHRHHKTRQTRTSTTPATPGPGVRLSDSLVIACITLNYRISSSSSSLSDHVTVLFKNPPRSEDVPVLEIPPRRPSVRSPTESVYISCIPVLSVVVTSTREGSAGFFQVSSGSVTRFQSYVRPHV